MFNKVVVGVDGSPASRRALQFAAAQARMHGAPLTVVMAWHYPAVAYLPFVVHGVAPADAMDNAARTALAELVVEVLGEAPDLTVEQIAVWATPRQALLEQARPGTLLVVGHHDVTEVADLMFGRVIDHVVDDAVCPVAVVPASYEPSS